MFEHVFDTGGVVDRGPMRDMARQVPPTVIAGQRITRSPSPVPVRAWIIDGRGRDVQVDGEAVAWTPSAVHVRYRDEHGRAGTAWVWASAVTRR
ncbi:hypothetical protein [Cellulomonas sp. PS-H5]|uniref:hypothetical protein n=1 Tax=Cellulomonas sp. PS-H5 TaxID=2820400 RepID=UPI001C4F6CB1|nr:hypothetical protein [Cellulomonas sp. PS-H5]MBW0254480.1 hypothetical protein [Cellulomonas sp. PS-H5]